MKPLAAPRQAPCPLAPTPGWMARAKAQSLEDMAFLSGAALARLHQAATSEALPQALWRERLALAAAVASVGLSGRREGAADLRDALELLRPGDQPGPAGAVLRQWRLAAARPVSVANITRALPDLTPDRIAQALGASPGTTPVAGAAAVLEAMLEAAPRAETAALILADAVLARAARWDPLLPLLAAGLTPRDLRLRGAELRLACHRALVDTAGQAVSLAADLTRRAESLRTVAPKLRAKGAAQAVALFLARDALTPNGLSAFLSDRAARRLCDRLVALGVLRELTGRDSFRLYGI